MVSQYDKLRIHFDGLNFAQKKQFIDKLKAMPTRTPEHSRFVSECVQKYNATAQDVATCAPQMALDKLLISGNGKKYSAYVVLGGISSIAMPLLAYFFYFKELIEEADRYSALTGGNRPLMAFVFVCIIMTLISIYEVIYYVCLSKTNIKVYETGIEGNGFEKSPFSLNNTKLTYGQITSVDLKSNKAVVVFTSNAKYTYYVGNAKEIRDVIFQYHNKIM